MRGKTYFKLDGATIENFTELYDPTNLPNSIKIKGINYFIDTITDEVCTETAMNSGVSYLLCRTIHLKLYNNS